MESSPAHLIYSIGSLSIVNVGPSSQHSIVTTHRYLGKPIWRVFQQKSNNSFAFNLVIQTHLTCIHNQEVSNFLAQIQHFLRLQLSNNSLVLWKTHLSKDPIWHVLWEEFGLWHVYALLLIKSWEPVTSIFWLAFQMLMLTLDCAQLIPSNLTVIVRRKKGG